MSNLTTIQLEVKNAITVYLKNLNDQPLNLSLHQDLITQVESSLIETVLEHTMGNQTLAANILGLSRTTLRKKIKKYKLSTTS